ncbi:hypothetical protein [Aliihoeflea sp. PC F10.4]
MSYDPLSIDVYPPRGRDGLWRMLLDLDAKGPWSNGEAMNATNLNRGTVAEWLARLRKAGFAEQVGERPHHRGAPAIALYQLTRRPIEAPRVSRDGTILPELQIELLWRTIKMLKSFSIDELVAAASADDRTIHRNSADSYVRELARVGILAKSGPLRARQFRLLRNVGALAPKLLTSKVVYDPNSHAVIGEATTREVAS